MPRSSLLEFDTGVARNGDTRRSNLLVVLGCIEAHGTIPQREISAETGLPPAAVSVLVTQLFERGLLEEGEAEPTGGRGRPRRLLSISARAASAVGIDVSSERIVVRVVDAAGGEIATALLHHTSTDIDPEPFSPLIFDLLRRAVPGPVLDRPLSVVIAVPGLVSEGITTAPSRGWVAASVDDLFTAAPGSLVLQRTVNDGDAAVIAEYTRSAATSSRNVIVLHGTDGVAGGIVSEGRLLLGFAGAASSLGHVPIEADGQPCPCGSRGCFGVYVSIPAFARILDRTAELESVSLAEFAERLRAQAAAGSPEVLRLLESSRQRIRVLGRILGAVVSPEVIVLTGNLMPLAPWLENPAPRHHLQQEKRIEWESPVIASAFEGDSVVVGAAELARRSLLLRPDLMTPTS